MKICSQCGAGFSDSRLACPRCGGAPISGRAEQSNDPFSARYENLHSKYGDQRIPDNNLYRTNPDGTRVIDWYESLWFIILTVICGIWPVSIAMIALRVYRNSVFETVQKPDGPGYTQAGPQAEQGAQGQAQGAQQAGQQAGQQGAGPGAQQAAGQSPFNAYQGQARPYSTAATRKTRGIGKMILGSVLGGIGLLFLAVLPGMRETTDITIGLAMSVIFLVPSAALIANFLGSNKDWHRYEALINNRGNTRIDLIARKVGRKEDRVRTDLQKMINKGFLSEPQNRISAYIDGEYDLVVMMKDGKPIVPVEETMADEIARQKAKEEAAADKARRNAAVSPEDKFIIALDDAAAATSDEDSIKYFKSMKRSMTNIKKLLADSPETNDRKSIQKMKESYIPSTIEMIEKYTDSATSEDTKLQIKGMLSTMATAYKNIEKQLQQQDDIDTGIDIEVMRQTLARDGLLDPDFNVRP